MWFYFRTLPHHLLFIILNKAIYTLSHPENDRDVTERAKGNTLQDASFMRQSRNSYLNVCDNTHVTPAILTISSGIPTDVTVVLMVRQSIECSLPWHCTFDIFCHISCENKENVATVPNGQGGTNRTVCICTADDYIWAITTYIWSTDIYIWTRYCQNILLENILQIMPGNIWSSPCPREGLKTSLWKASFFLVDTVTMVTSVWSCYWKHTPRLLHPCFVAIVTGPDRHTFISLDPAKVHLSQPFFICLHRAQI